MHFVLKNSCSRVIHLLKKLSLASVYLILVALAWSNEVTAATNIWEGGRLDYANGGTEVAAFINLPEQLQVQVVLCSQHEQSSYRLTLLLPCQAEVNGLIPLKLNVDGVITTAYGEIVGNAIEIQPGVNFLITLPDCSAFDIEFEPQDAQLLNLPPILKIPMQNAGLVLTQMARSCIILNQSENFDNNLPLISGILWPRNGFDQETIKPIEKACLFKNIKEISNYVQNQSLVRSLSVNRLQEDDSFSNYEQSPNTNPYLGRSNFERVNVKEVKEFNYHINPKKLPIFYLSDQCRIALDQAYEKEGKWALSFLPALFKAPDSAYQRYKSRWNVVADSVAQDQLSKILTMASDYDYYLILFSLLSNQAIRQYPQSYYDALNYISDPSSFLYEVDNRYELETIKYASALKRRLKGSLSTLQSEIGALQNWNLFYQDFSSALPVIPKAQALRPLLYRQMLMRIWRLAGKPQPLRLKDEYIFKQGTQGKTITKDVLEARCSLFDGSNGDQFFFASPECVYGVDNDLRRLGLHNKDFDEVQGKWDRFAQEWSRSVFYSDSTEDAVGEHSRSSLVLTMLSLYKNYGFGDYYLLSKCLSTRDRDICAYDAEQSLSNYFNELRNTIMSIAQASRDDATTLRHLNDLWNDYYEGLKVYTTNLEQRGKIESWRKYFVLGVAITSQTEAMLNAPFYAKAGLEEE